MRESNSHPRITKPMFYHLTNRALVARVGVAPTEMGLWDPFEYSFSSHNSCHALVGIYSISSSSLERDWIGLCYAEPYHNSAVLVWWKLQKIPHAMLETARISQLNPINLPLLFTSLRLMILLPAEFLATRRGIEPLCSARQADIIATIWTSQK